MIFLTQMQLALIEYVKTYRSESGRGPSRSRIQDFCGYETADAVRDDIETLIDAGYLRKNGDIGGLLDLEVIAEPGDEVMPISNCRSTQLLQEAFSQPNVLAAMRPKLRERVIAHMKAVSVRGAS